MSGSYGVSEMGRRAVVAFEKELMKIAQDELDSWCDDKELEADVLAASHEEDDKTYGGLHRDWQVLEHKRRLEKIFLWDSHVKEKGLVKQKLKDKMSAIIKEWVPKIEKADHARLLRGRVRGRVHDTASLRKRRGRV